MKIYNLRLSEISNIVSEPSYEWFELLENRPEKDIWRAFDHSVYIMHHDGSILNLSNAFLIKKKNEILVISEHMGYFVFHTGDLIEYKEKK